LKQFIRKGMPWCHLDIAYTANNMGQIPYFPKKGASGMHVRTLAHFVAEY
jgi:leucyl aminopeptidase